MIDIVEEERLIQRSAEMGDYFVDHLRVLQSKHCLVVDVRGRGLMIALQLSPERRAGRKEMLAFDFAMLCERQGLHVTFSYYEPVIRFIPPLIISRAEIDLCIAVLDKVLDTLERDSETPSQAYPRNVRSGPFIERMNGKVAPSEMLRKVWNTSPRQWVEKLKEIL